MTPLESLTKKLHALLPELCWRVSTTCPDGKIGCLTMHTREICEEVNLEHVLKALGILAKAEYLGMRMACDGSTLLLWWTLMLSGFHERAKEYPWQLGLPLDQQSPETIEFLDNLIPEQK